MKIYILTAEYGRYDDVSRRLIVAYDNKEKADEHCRKCRVFAERYAQMLQDIETIKRYYEQACVDAYIKDSNEGGKTVVPTPVYPDLPPMTDSPDPRFTGESDTIYYVEEVELE